MRRGKKRNIWRLKVWNYFLFYRFVDLLPFINLIWSAPLQIILTLYFLWHELGPSVLAGLAVMVCMIPLNGWISAYQRRLQIKQMKKKDERVKVVGEILGGMRVIKLYGWEVTAY